MKKMIVFCIALLMIGIGMTQTINTADAAFSKDEVVRERFALKREQLAEVVSKKIAHVENSIKKKLKEQEANKIKKQKEEEDKKAAAKKAEEEQAANQAAAQEAAQAEEAAKQAVIQEEQQAPQAQGDGETADAVSGASANGQERGQRNREWGNQLSDPNLTPAERQGIIQEKKNYNRNNH
ncbi:hypothetical protein BCR24_10525 [Enterococcus ureilyticus]|uniref:Uncharacterized protein n=1 Tax=Enterococcus ureilyticus TaxID=1131292 RepID=A0A1E5HFL2_9ENTE|nr:hypothetical protein [Enterococcus ureilyticus]MBM7689407.1 Skp family chaperone for outer membrane proteins [Enterococcus ureilyticus]OEG23738.1 hypothetical protein BCR24_10525 [Enterococcus ureilyticus]